MKIKKFVREKVKFSKFSTESENLAKIGGKSETVGKCIMASEGMDAPGYKTCPETEYRSAVFNR